MFTKCQCGELLTPTVQVCPQCGEPNEEFGRELRLATRLPMAIGAGLLVWASIKFDMPWYAPAVIIVVAGTLTFGIMERPPRRKG
jgi:hypothetical protein